MCQLSQQMVVAGVDRVPVLAMILETIEHQQLVASDNAWILRQFKVLQGYVASTRPPGHAPADYHLLMETLNYQPLTSPRSQVGR